MRTLEADVIERTGEVGVERKFGLGGTGITYRAVASGEIDLYPEYTGTALMAVLDLPPENNAAAVFEHPQRASVKSTDRSSPSAPMRSSSPGRGPSPKRLLAWNASLLAMWVPGAAALGLLAFLSACGRVD